VKDPFKGIADCFVRTVKNEGFISLWRGNWANVVRYFPTQALNFSFKDLFNSVFNKYDSKKESTKFFLSNLLSGGCAGTLTTFFVYPLDFARTRLGVDLGRKMEDRQFTGIADCLKKVFKKDGIVGLYRGFIMSVIGIFIYRGLYFGLYDTGKSWFIEGKDIGIIPRFFFA